MSKRGDKNLIVGLDIGTSAVRAVELTADAGRTPVLEAFGQVGLPAGVVVDGEVKIVDEFTGRVLDGRRYSEGLHQAIEAKEGVAIKEENQTLATITLQNFFRLYTKLAGMTGTAKTEEGEFAHIYDMGVVEVPTNEPIARADHVDVIYKTEEAKYTAAADDIAERHAPVS